MQFSATLFACIFLATHLCVAQSYKVVVSSALIAKSRVTQEGLRPWDAGTFAQSMPDTYVTIELDGVAVFISGQQKDSLNPRWFRGTDYWAKPASTRVKISLFDADAGTLASRVGVAGVCLRPDLPNFGKKLINRALLDVNSDDLIGAWSGTLGQLLQMTGGPFKEGELVRRVKRGATAVRQRALQSLKVRVIPKMRLGEGVSTGSVLGLRSIQLEVNKRSALGGRRLPWDIGAGKASAPDPRYVIYVNGDPVIVGRTNQDTTSAIWPSPSRATRLRSDDQVAIEVLDADAGSMLKALGRASILMTDGMTSKQKQQLLEELNQAASDDPVFLWVGAWKTLRGLSSSDSLLGPKINRGIWHNNGLQKVTLARGASSSTAAASGKSLKLSINLLRVSKTKANRRAWDLRGGPDPFITVSVPAAKGGWQVIAKTKPVQDAWAINPGLRSNDRRLKPGALVKIEAFDHDRTGNDLIGTVSLRVPPKPATLSKQAQQITALTLQFY